MDYSKPAGRLVWARLLCKDCARWSRNEAGSEPSLILFKQGYRLSRTPSLQHVLFSMVQSKATSRNQIYALAYRHMARAVKGLATLLQPGRIFAPSPLLGVLSGSIKRRNLGFMECIELQSFHDSYQP